VIVRELGELVPRDERAGLGLEVEHDHHLAARQLGEHTLALFVERELALAVVRTLSGDELLHQAEQCLAGELVGRNLDDWAHGCTIARATTAHPARRAASASTHP